VTNPDEFEQKPSLSFTQMPSSGGSSFIVSNVPNEMAQTFKTILHKSSKTTSIDIPISTPQTTAKEKPVNDRNNKEDTSSSPKIELKREETKQMSHNDNMSDTYSKTETDLMFKNIEQKMLTMETKIDGKLDLIVEKVGALNTRIEDLWKVIVGLGFGIGGAILAGVIVIIIQNATTPPAQNITVQQPQALEHQQQANPKAP